MNLDELNIKAIKNTTMRGPLAGLRVVEFAGLGPAPFACMLLSDMGAEVVTVDRLDAKIPNSKDIVGRGRKIVRADLKEPIVQQKVMALIDSADVLIEGFRPGVMERLGFGPDVLLERNPKLVFGRMTGWGQDGPWAQSAGHDINYISITGALHAIGSRNGPPVPPLNLVGDYAGGSMYLLVGILAALLESKKSGKGQVVDAAIADGAISLMSHFFGSFAAGEFVEQRASNMLDGGTPYYDVYETLDGKYLSVGALEPKFFAALSKIILLSDEMILAHSNPEMWPDLRSEFQAIFKTKTRDQWMELFDATDACVAPVLSLNEADAHVHNQYRQSIVTIDGVKQPAPAPRFSRTPSVIQGELSRKFFDIDQLILEWQ